MSIKRIALYTAALVLLRLGARVDSVILWYLLANAALYIWCLGDRDFVREQDARQNP